VTVVLAVLALEATATGSRHVCPLEPSLEDEPSSEHWLEGTVGGGRVRMYLERGGGAVTGAYYYTKHWEPLLLAGTWLGQGELRLSEKTEKGAETGTFQGILGAAGLTGQWTSADGQRRAPVRLRVVRAPRCDATGPWQTFDDPSWPVTFSYPASWHVRRAGDSISVACPDPAQLIYADSDIQLVTGQGLARFDRGEGSFYRCRGRWIHNSISLMAGCECSDPRHVDCTPRVATTRDGVTVMGGSAEVRVYCRGGGYFGAGEREERLILIGDRWVELDGEVKDEQVVARMAATIRLR